MPRSFLTGIDFRFARGQRRPAVASFAGRPLRAAAARPSTSPRTVFRSSTKRSRLTAQTSQPCNRGRKIKPFGQKARPGRMTQHGSSWKRNKFSSRCPSAARHACGGGAASSAGLQSPRRERGSGGRRGSELINVDVDSCLVSR